MKVTKKDVEERKKSEEQRKQAFRLEIVDLEHDCVSIKSPIILTRKQYDLIQKICDVTGEEIQTYIKDALLQTIQIDLENPSCLGKQICDHLLPEWDSIKPQ
jgi:hypothetical protein